MLYQIQHLSNQICVILTILTMTIRCIQRQYGYWFIFSTRSIVHRRNAQMDGHGWSPCCGPSLSSEISRYQNKIQIKAKVMYCLSPCEIAGVCGVKRLTRKGGSSLYKYRLLQSTFCKGNYKFLCAVSLSRDHQLDSTIQYSMVQRFGTLQPQTLSRMKLPNIGMSEILRFLTNFEENGCNNELVCLMRTDSPKQTQPATVAECYIRYNIFQIKYVLYQQY
eukprot:TRINITY_DN1122_c0_g2_i2.p1 TRINITY_DN1122_c0_g2~~TRINITY_DN1122_c0_g2_i2.p1  ORF type:complete len:221 (-),score=-24.01 TRINITY_DN1122_c0_g2_i2:51-713(-)